MLSSWILGVGAAVVFLSPASAAVIGHLSVTNCGGGGVTVGATTIDWLIGSPSACLQLGAGTNVTSVGDGTLTPLSPNGTINDLPPSSGVIGFMSFFNASPFISMSFDLAAVGGFGPGNATSCAVNPAVGFSCSVPGSPFILTTTTTGTSVALLAHGTIFDAGDGVTSVWNGAFTTQLNSTPSNDQSPSAVQATILGGGFVTSSVSGEFDISAQTPEPNYWLLIGGALVVLGWQKRHKMTA